MNMSKTALDSLIQLTVADTLAPSAGRSRGVGPAFDDHLRELQSTSQPPSVSKRNTATTEEPNRPVRQATAERDRNQDTDEVTATDAEQESATVDSPQTDEEDNSAAVTDERDDSVGEDTEDDAAAAAVAQTAQDVVVITESAGDASAGADDGSTAADAQQAAAGVNQSEGVETAAVESTSEVDVAQPSDDAPVVDEEVADEPATQSQTESATTGGADSQDGVQQPVAESAERRQNHRQAEPETADKQQGPAPAATEQTAELERPVDSDSATDQGSRQRRAADTSAAAGTKSAAGSETASSSADSARTALAAAAAASGDDAATQPAPTDTASVDPGASRAAAVLNSLASYPRTTAAGSAHRASEGQDLPRVDAGRFVTRVAKAFETAQQRGGTLQLRLSPPELGSMKLELTVERGVLTASIETDNNAARQTLLQHLPALRERLAEQNIRVERFDVDVRQDTGNGQSSAGSQQQPHEPAPGDVGMRPPTAAPEVSSEDVPTPAPATSDGTGINLII